MNGRGQGEGGGSDQLHLQPAADASRGARERIERHIMLVGVEHPIELLAGAHCRIEMLDRLDVGILCGRRPGHGQSGDGHLVPAGTGFHMHQEAEVRINQEALEGLTASLRATAEELEIAQTASE